MSGQEVTTKPDRTPLSQRNPVELAQHFANSGYFKDANDMSKAVVKIVAGEELGLGPMAAMQGIHIIEGKPSLSANTLALLIKRHESYDYIVKDQTDQRCEIEFLQNGDPIGTATWTIEEAQRAKTFQKGNMIKLADTLRWKNAPSDMLFARCISRGARRFCPDVTAGSPAYTPEELEQSIDTDPVYVQNETPEPQAAAEPEEVHGEVVDGGDVETITKAEAGRIFDHAKSISTLDPDQFAQAVAYCGEQTEVDVSTKKAAVEVLTAFNPKQAKQLVDWLERFESKPAASTEETQGEETPNE